MPKSIVLDIAVNESQFWSPNTKILAGINANVDTVYLTTRNKCSFPEAVCEVLATETNGQDIISPEHCCAETYHADHAC